MSQANTAHYITYNVTIYLLFCLPISCQFFYCYASKLSQTQGLKQAHTLIILQVIILYVRSLMWPQ